MCARCNNGTIPSGEVFIVEDRSTGEAEGGGAPGVDDSVLVVEAQRGDIQAFGTLVDRYHAQVYGITTRMCGPEQADDLTQDVFLKALSAVRQFQFRGDASFRTWLYRIAINTAINELRHRKRHRQTAGPSLDEPLQIEQGQVSRELSDVSGEPYRNIEQGELQRAVHETLDMLTPKQRATLVLIDLGELNYEEAAEVLGCPLGTLKSRLVRARSAFAEKFRQHQPEWLPGAAGGTE